MSSARYTLSLADGAKIRLWAAAGFSSEFLDRFARAAGLPGAGGGRPTRSIGVKPAGDFRGVSGEGECLLPPIKSPSAFFCHAVDLTMAIGRIVQHRGGTLLHGALAEFHGRGVLLAAPGGTGKSTASARLPKPWRSLCDDTTLVVPDARGKIWAHPWPTLSRFLEGGPGGTWETGRAVPLAACYFLIQATGEQVHAVGGGEGLSLLAESSEQASQAMSRRRSPEEGRAVRRERFENLTAIARTVPVHLLRLSLKGEFWKEIERTL